MSRNPSAKNEPKVRIGIILPTELHEQGKIAARRERRSFSGYVASLLDRPSRKRDTGKVTA